MVTLLSCSQVHFVISLVLLSCFGSEQPSMMIFMGQLVKYAARLEYFLPFLVALEYCIYFSFVAGSLTVHPADGKPHQSVMSLEVCWM